MMTSIVLPFKDTVRRLFQVRLGTILSLLQMDNFKHHNNKITKSVGVCDCFWEATDTHTRLIDRLIDRGGADPPCA